MSQLFMEVVGESNLIYYVNIDQIEYIYTHRGEARFHVVRFRAGSEIVVPNVSAEKLIAEMKRKMILTI